MAEQGDGDNQAPSHPLGSAVRANQGALIGLAVFGILLMKVLSVARFDPTTAVGLVTYGGTANVLIGAAMDAIAPIVLASGALCLWWIDDDRTIPQSTTRWMVGILLIFSAVVLPVLGAILYLLVGFLILGVPPFSSLVHWLHTRDLRRLSKHHEEQLNELEASQAEAENALAALDQEPESDELQQRVAAAAAGLIESSRDALESAEKQVEAADEMVDAARKGRARTPSALTAFALVQAGLALVFLLSSTPWLPAERLYFDRSDPMTAYPIGVEESELIVLTSGNQQLERIPVGEIKGREFCSPSPEPKGISRSWASILFGRESYPRCSSLEDDR